jgi:hypothetical protein
MTTKLIGPLKRELDVAGRLYTITITPEGFKLVPKGGRKGYQLKWSSFVSGETALVTALNASLLDARAIRRPPEKKVPPTRGRKR